MASVKIGQLVIRTLAKPIASQLKNQAANHETFRKACIALAQFNHRVELKLRSNLIGGTQQKIRPLNDSKAIANGANAISEGFLFAVAAALIIGETYRGSRSRAKQRDSTEAAVEEVRSMVEALAQRLDIPLEEIKPPTISDQEEEIRPDSTEFVSETKLESSESVVKRRNKDQEELERLRASVQVLLSMALRSGWIEGEEALRLDDILQGKDTKESSTHQSSQTSTESQSTSNSNSSIENDSKSSTSPSYSPSSSSSPSISLQTLSTNSSPSSLSTITANHKSSSDSTSSQIKNRSEILAAVARERVQTMISELIEERKRGNGLEGEGGSEVWNSSNSNSNFNRPIGGSGEEGDALGAASRLAEMMERAGTSTSSTTE